MKKRFFNFSFIDAFMSALMVSQALNERPCTENKTETKDETNNNYSPLRTFRTGNQRKILCNPRGEEIQPYQCD